MTNKTGIEKYRRGLEEESGKFEYSYDRLSRLTGVIKDDTMIKTFGFDEFGNRSFMVEQGTKTNYEHNALNQLLHLENSIKTQDFSYDQRGNLTKITENGNVKNTYEFSPLNRLTKATNKAGQTARYDYNGLGFRVGKQITDEINPTKNIGYVLDITKQYHNLLQMSDDTKTQNYTWDYNVVFADDNAYLQDELGSPLRYLDATGTLIDSFGYDEFGVQTSGEHSQPFGFTGYQYDNISGTYFAQAREYRAEVGRFVSEDIIRGTISFADTLNPYVYCLNSPLWLVDLDGREPVPVPYWIEAIEKGNDAHTTLRESKEIKNTFGLQSEVYIKSGLKTIDNSILSYTTKSGNGFADYVYFRGATAEIYELKPATTYGQTMGPKQVKAYEYALNNNGQYPMYTFSVGKTPIKAFNTTLDSLKGQGRTITYSQNSGGIIYYKINDPIPQNQPVPGVVPELEKAKDPSFKIDWAKVGEVALGVGTCTVAGLGIAWLVGNNVSGIGILDDFLIAPAGALFAKGLGMCIK